MFPKAISKAFSLLCCRPGDTLRDSEAPPSRPVNRVDRAKMDSEYSALMAELGEGPPPAASHHNNSGSRSRFGNQPRSNDVSSRATQADSRTRALYDHLYVKLAISSRLY